MKRNHRIFLLLTASVLMIFSCKRDDFSSGNYASMAKMKDSAWSYAKELYLWNTHLPAALNIRSLTDPDAVMKAIRPYSIEPGFSQPVDRWSFALKKSEWDDLSSGISSDFGLGLFFRSENDLRVSYVEPASPAAAAGVERSWQIISVNNNTGINTDDATISRIRDAVFDSPFADFIFKKPDGAEVEISLTASTYREEAILLDTVYTTGSHTTGYFVLNSFLGDIPAMKSRFDSLFNRFTAAGINDLIVDLRYNGGGFVKLQNEMANYLVPAAGNRDVMLKEAFNDNYKTFFDTTIYYLKKGSLNLNRIFFIITQNTASASELLINSLKPYMEVKLLGRPSNGKPVGYFNIGVGDWYIFPVSFRSVNKNGEGNYFSGMIPDAAVDDGLDKPWGDVEESSLASALHYINDGAFSRIAARTQMGPRLKKGNDALLVHRFKGAVREMR